MKNFVHVFTYLNDRLFELENDVNNYGKALGCEPVSIQLNQVGYKTYVIVLFKVCEV